MRSVLRRSTVRRRGTAAVAAAMMIAVTVLVAALAVTHLLHAEGAVAIGVHARQHGAPARLELLSRQHAVTVGVEPEHHLLQAFLALCLAGFVEFLDRQLAVPIGLRTGESRGAEGAP